MIKFYIFAAAAAALILSASAETITLKTPEDIAIQPRNSKVQYTVGSVFDTSLNRDVLKINYVLPPGTAGNVYFDITFPGLENMEWQSIDSVKLHFRGGLGHISVGIADRDSEEFRFKKSTLLRYNDWESHISFFHDPTSCHQGISRKNKDKKNGIPDAPLKIASARVVIYPAYIASQLRGQLISTGTKATSEELARGMKPVDLYLSALEINGVRFGETPAAKTEKSSVTAEFAEIGTSVPLKTGNREVLRYTLSNHGEESVRVHVSAVSTLVLASGKENYRQEVSLAPGGKKTVELPFRFQKPGFYDVRLSLAENGRENHAKTFVNVWSPVGNDWQDIPETFFGTQAGLDRFNNVFGKYREQDYKNMRDAGVKLLRFTLRWRDIQPARDGKMNWTVYDGIFKKIKEYGMIPYPMLSNAPDWACNNPEVLKNKPAWVMSCAPDNKVFAEFAAKAAERYKDDTNYFQIWNEPHAHHYYWGGDMNSYTDMLKECYAAIRKANPNAKVCSGTAWDEVFQMAKGSYDIWPFHWHGDVEMLHSLIAKHRRMAGGENADMSQFWCDETGFSVDPNEEGSELRKAAVIVQKAVVCRAEGIGSHVWFVYRHSPGGPTNPRDNYPAIDEKNRCRPVVIAHNNAVRQIRQSSVMQKKRIPGVGEAYLFRRNGEQVIAFWRSDLPKGQILTVKLDKPVSGVRTNLFGSDTPFECKDGTLSMIMTGEPQFLSFPASTEVKDITITSFLHVPYQSICSSADKTLTLNCIISNPFNDMLNGTFRFLPANGWKPEKENYSVSLKPKESRKIAIRYLAAEKVPALAYPAFEFTDKAHEIAIRSDMKFVTSMSVTPEWKLLAAPDSREFIHSLRTGDVDADLFWQGKEDLSAKIYGKWTQSALALKIDVRDNIHHQTQSGHAVYDGDSIQIALLPTRASQVINSPVTAADGYSQFGLALTNDGKTLFHQWKGKFARIPDFKVTRKGKNTVYEVSIPWQELGITGSPLGQTFNLSVLVNDNDGRFRKVLLEWGGGIHGLSGKPMNPMIVTR